MNHNDRINEVKGEKIIPEFFVMSLVSFAPKWFRPFVGFVAKHLLKQPRFGELMGMPIIQDNTDLL